MPKNENPQETFILKNVRLSFPDIFEPKAGDDSDKKRYKASFLMDPNDPANKAQILQVRAKMDEMWQTWTKKSDAKAPRDKTALRKGDDKEYEGYAGMWFISAARAESQGRPLLVDRQKKEYGEKTNELYAGCYVNVKIRVYCFEHPKSGKRINASIEVIQKFKDGEPFGAGKASADDMESYDEEDADLDDLEDDDDM